MSVFGERFADCNPCIVGAIAGTLVPQQVADRYWNLSVNCFTDLFAVLSFVASISGNVLK